MSIIVVTGAVLGGTGVLNSAAEAARALRPLAGSAAEVLFGLGLLGASALAAAVVPLSTSYAVAEALGVERSVSRNFREAPVFLGLFTAQIALGASVVLVPGNLIHLIVNTQVLEGIITPITLFFILLLANRKGLLGRGGQRPVRPLARGHLRGGGGRVRPAPGRPDRARLAGRRLMEPLGRRLPARRSRLRSRRAAGEAGGHGRQCRWVSRA